MRPNARLKGSVMIAACIVLFSVCFVFFRNEAWGKYVLFVLFACLIMVYGWMLRNSVRLQFREIMKRVGGENLRYATNDSACVSLRNLDVNYLLTRKRDGFLKRKYDVVVYCQCLLPVVTDSRAVYEHVRSDLGNALNVAFAGEPGIELSFTHFDNAQAFEVEIRICSEVVSDVLLTKIQEVLTEVLVRKYRLNEVKRYLKDIVGEDDYYWEFLGNRSMRMVSHNNITDEWEREDEDVDEMLLDYTDTVITITEGEFKTAWMKARA